MWFALLTYNSWYIACFTGLFAVVFAIVYLIVRLEQDTNIWKEVKITFIKIWKDAIGYFAFMIVLYIPFIMIYFPSFKESYYSYGACVPLLPEFADIINVGEDNLLLGKLIKFLRLADRGYSGELVEGFSIVLLILFIWMFILCNVRTIKLFYKDGKNTDYEQVIIRTSFIAVIICILLPVRLSCNGISLWEIVYYLFPVAKSMRAVARFFLWLSFPMAVISAYAANKYIRLNNPLLCSAIAAFAVSFFCFKY